MFGDDEVTPLPVNRNGGGHVLSGPAPQMVSQVQSHSNILRWIADAMDKAYADGSLQLLNVMLGDGQTELTIAVGMGETAARLKAHLMSQARSVRNA